MRQDDEDTAEADFRYDGDDLDVLALMPRYHRWIVRFFRPYLGGRMVEYGPGMGSISTKLVRFAEQLTLVEPASNLADHLRRRFAGDSRVDVVEALLERHIATVPPASLDAVVMVNVLEHVEHDLAAITATVQALKPGGHLLIFVPAMPALMSRLDVMHGHFRRYSREPLRQLVEQAGLEIQLLHYVDVIGVLPWWLLNTKLGITTFSPTMIRIYNLLLLPLTRFLERLVEPPFGKNLVLVARRNG
ncbi:hypothetical protein WV31_12880 [Magnetospirillum sp. ME-1]|uniref:class I SAM-dependent methyltransferase n=1 Tax=Magnetospirillum sp. ME-1 TaxID=1639348 RepID=UPI000A17E1D3|nr:class I SAM-dependent methyltransferase [Magnetospirillum sp. ME-1]ARJ66499.1 hypothetical protein WV31_12880 [Magnetospirillum sp. ME-1]